MVPKANLLEGYWEENYPPEEFGQGEVQQGSSYHVDKALKIQGEVLKRERKPHTS